MKDRDNTEHCETELSVCASPDTTTPKLDEDQDQGDLHAVDRTPPFHSELDLQHTRSDGHGENGDGVNDIEDEDACSEEADVRRQDCESQSQYDVIELIEG